MTYKVLACLALLAVSAAKRDQTRWSRQISSYTSDISDWVPLSGPIEREVPLQSKRQIVAEPRILSEPISELARPSEFNVDTFSSRGFYNGPGNRQLYLQSMPAVPSAPQNFLTDQGFNQGFRFGLSPPNFPLTQGFVAPQYNFDSVPQFRPKPQIPGNPIRFDNFQSPLQSHAPQVKPILSATPKPNKYDVPKYVDGYRAENHTDIRINQRKPQPPQNIKFEDYDKPKDVFPLPKTKLEREEVQLLYVPVESLNRGQFNFRSPITSGQFLNTDLYNQNQKPAPVRQNFGSEFQRPISKPLGTESLQSPEYLSHFNSQINGLNTNGFSTLSSPFPTSVATTPKPKKLKPHQPPLAIFLTQNVKGANDIKVGDVLTSLKSAKTVAVLDAINPLNAPEVFIGPSSLTPPENYVKFELPYLSNIENKDKKLKQLPFFVAPLSYNTPQGFAKIPFPSPHVGSVVINSQIQEASQSIKSTTAPDIIPNSYQDPTLYRERQAVTQKPRINYYSTVAPKENILNNYEQNYYSFEPQTVSTAQPLKEQYNKPITQPPKTASYFLSNIENQYKLPQFSVSQQVPNYKNPESIKPLNALKGETTSTPKTTTVTTKPTTTTRSNQLLQTHNPFSINQAFHFSTPNDYQNNFDEYKESYATQKFNSPSSSSTATASYPTKEVNQYEETFKPSSLNQQATPSYSQNYSPEIHYQAEIQRPHYQTYNTDKEQSQEIDYPQSIGSSNVNDNIKSVELKPLTDSDVQSKTQLPLLENYTKAANDEHESQLSDIETTKLHEEYQYNSYGSEETHTSSTTTTTRKTPTRTRGRPRYPSNKPEPTEYSTRPVITRKPPRERRPLPSRSRYEPSKTTTEKSTRKPFEPSESTTRSYKPRTRGKVHFKPSEGEEIYDKHSKQSSKEHDLAYQRDILHQNYPVTLMERASTVDIEAITDPSAKESFENTETTKEYDTENADSNDKLSITENINSQIKDVSQYNSAIDSNTDIRVKKVPSRIGNQYSYESRTVLPSQENKSSEESKEDTYSSHTTSEVYEHDLLNIKTDKSEYEQTSSDNDEYVTQEKITTLPTTENVKIESHEIQQQEQEDNIVETTPSYNRVRIRPGVIRQHYQPSSTESSKIKNDRRQNIPITYRPAFDKRRTTMRIEEIEADLKTKQVHSRPEFKDYKQPVYKPEPTPETTSTTTEASTRRNQFRRKRPTYTTSSTEGTVNRKPYEVKNRFRGRRPTDKPTEKPETQTEGTSTSTVRNVKYNRYSRPKLSERFNKKPEPDDTTSEDQDIHFSLHRPKYAPPDVERWSPKISNDSFKPYNPNNIEEENKVENNDHKIIDEELDIITAKNDNEVLISVTPATNNRVNKNILEVSPTLEALEENARLLKNDTEETSSTFELMLEEVMKNLEEQDEDEYTSNVMKHKGGEIGEIPPEKVISSGVNYSLKSTRTAIEQTTTPPSQSDKISSLSDNEEDQTRKNRRRGYWKKVKVRPAADGIDVAESQYYSDTINTLGKTISRNTNGKATDKSKYTVTTYKPPYELLKNLFEAEDESIDVIPNLDVPKLNNNHSVEAETKKITELFTTETSILLKSTPSDDLNPGDMDLGTGSPDPTYDDSSYYSEPTEPTSTSTKVDRSDKFSLMDYLFGITSPDETDLDINSTETKANSTTTEKYQDSVEAETQTVKSKATTESPYMPEEMTTETNSENVDFVSKSVKITTNEKEEAVESSSVSSFMNPTNIISTSMSTEISHETEICFRGKCIKTNKDIL